MRRSCPFIGTPQFTLNYSPPCRRNGVRGVRVERENVAFDVMYSDRLFQFTKPAIACQNLNDFEIKVAR